MTETTAGALSAHEERLTRLSRVLTETTIDLATRFPRTPGCPGRDADWLAKKALALVTELQHLLDEEEPNGSIGE